MLEAASSNECTELSMRNTLSHNRCTCTGIVEAFVTCVYFDVLLQRGSVTKNFATCRALQLERVVAVMTCYMSA